MKGNRQNWREDVSIFGSCGLPYIAVFFDVSKAQYTHTHKRSHTLAPNHTPTILFAEQHQKGLFAWAAFSILPLINKSCCFVSAVSSIILQEHTGRRDHDAAAQGKTALITFIYILLVFGVKCSATSESCARSKSQYQNQHFQFFASL